MKMLGVVLIMLSIFKLSCVGSFNREDILDKFAYLPIDIESVYKTVNGLLVFDGLVGLMCGAFIVFI